MELDLPSPRIWAHIRGRYWSAKINDSSLQLLLLKTAVLPLWACGVRDHPWPRWSSWSSPWRSPPGWSPTRPPWPTVRTRSAQVFSLCHSWILLKPKFSNLLNSSTLHTLQRKSHLFIPKKGIARPQSQFPHSCICERFIHYHDPSTYFLAAE